MHSVHETRFGHCFHWSPAAGASYENVLPVFRFLNDFELINARNHAISIPI